MGNKIIRFFAVFAVAAVLIVTPVAVSAGAHVLDVPGRECEKGKHVGNPHCESR